MLAENTMGLGSVRIDSNDLYWIEARWSDQGRNVVVRRTAGGRIEDVVGAPFNARTRVHEYGGGAYAVHGGTLWFSNLFDSRVYRLDRGGEARPITREGAMRYADFAVDTRRGRLVCVREDHENLARSSTPGSEERPPEARSAVVALPGGGGGEPRVLVEGGDFYAAPRLDPRGERLCWLTWDHPDMPWDGCELWVADLDGDGAAGNARRVAGGRDESIFQPEWSPDGVLHYVSDRTGWWNLYRHDDGKDAQPLAPMDAEFGRPMWVLGMSTYGFAGDGRVVCSWIQRGFGHLGVIDAQGRLRELDVAAFAVGPSVQAADGRAYVVAAGSAALPRLIAVDCDSGDVEVIRTAGDMAVEPGWISAAQSVEFPTEGGRTAYGFFYPPQNAECTVPVGELPPLLVNTHGGPTDGADPAFDPSIQYWTSRGFAYLDVDYGGSTGYGREYRKRLDRAWGIVDLDDCANGALHLAHQGLVDGARLLIHGGSAGGFTTLAVLTFRDTFAAGASHYGVADLELLARETHKFESRYLDRLVGPYPAAAEVYRERSPLHHTDQLSRPVILFHGLDDRVVPPNQSQVLFEALRDKGIPCAFVAFEGEDHGFRKADSIVRAREGELWFYGRVFGFRPAGEITRVTVENLPGED